MNLPVPITPHHSHHMGAGTQLDDRVVTSFDNDLTYFTAAQVLRCQDLQFRLEKSSKAMSVSLCTRFQPNLPRLMLRGCKLVTYKYPNPVSFGIFISLLAYLAPHNLSTE